jgi:hypothetical protein
MNMPVFTESMEGTLRLSALRQDNNGGEVTLVTTCGNGSTLKENIIRLPKSSTLQKSYSNLVSANSHKNLRLVLNMAGQQSYDMK